MAEGLGAMTFQPGDRHGDRYGDRYGDRQSDRYGDRQGDWRCRAACRNGDPDRLFVRGAAQREAKLVCFGCPVRTECLAEALDHRIEFGVWGGMTERERRALLRRRPTASWRKVLESARDREIAQITASA